MAKRLEVELLAIESLRETPAGIDAGHGAQALFRLVVIPAIIPGGVGRQRCLDAFQEHEIVARAFGRTAKRRDALDHVGIHRPPMEGLQRTHRPADNQLQFLDAEFLGHQLVLGADIVVGRYLREARLVVGLRRVAWRRRQPVAEHVRDDDEIFSRVERHALADQPFIVDVLAGIPGREDDDIVLLGVQLAEGFVGKFGVAQRRPALQDKIAQRIDFIVRHQAVSFTFECGDEAR